MSLNGDNIFRTEELVICLKVFTSQEFYLKLVRLLAAILITLTKMSNGTIHKVEIAF